MHHRDPDLEEVEFFTRFRGTLMDASIDNEEAIWWWYSADPDEEVERCPLGCCFWGEAAARLTPPPLTEDQRTEHTVALMLQEAS